MRRIKNAEVKRLALCRRGKNNLTTLFKADKGEFEFATLAKAGEEEGSLLAVMWPKDLADIDGDFADTDEAIDSMMSSLIANGGQLDIEHDGKVLSREDARITEVFRIQEGDPRFEDWKDYQGEVQDVTGGAAVHIQIDHPELRADCREGKLDGVSLFGPAAVEQVDPKAAGRRVAARIAKSAGNTENDMDEKQLKEVLSAFKAEVAELVKSTVAEAVAPADTNTNPEGSADSNADAPELPERPTFSGNASSAEDLAAFQGELRAWEINVALAKGELSADQVAELAKSAAEVAPSDAEAGIEQGDSDEVRGLKRQLFKAQKRTNAPAEGRGEDTEATLAKAQEDEGLAIAGLANDMWGAAPQSFQVVPKS